MQRRTALTLLTGGIVAPSLVQKPAQPARAPRTLTAAGTPEPLLFFSDSENALLDRLTEMIIPSDGRSGGAHAAQVSRYIDRETAYRSQEAQEQWRTWLKAVDDAARERFGTSFLECDAASQDKLMAEWAANEKEPKSDLEQFFVRLKRDTAFAYYTTEVGLLQELGYKGNDVLDEFPGCTDPNCKYCHQ